MSSLVVAGVGSPHLHPALLVRHDLKPRPPWTIGHDRRTRLRPMGAELCLAAFDPMLEHPRMDQECDRCTRDRNQEGHADLDGGGIDSNEHHDCLQ